MNKAFLLSWFFKLSNSIKVRPEGLQIAFTRQSRAKAGDRFCRDLVRFSELVETKSNTNNGGN